MCKSIPLVSFVRSSYQKPVPARRANSRKGPVLCLPDEDPQRARCFPAYLWRSASHGRRPAQIMDSWERAPREREIRELCEIGYMLDPEATGELTQISAGIIHALGIVCCPKRLPPLLAWRPIHRVK